MTFRPALIPTLFVVVGLAILLSLGTWQLRRHHEAQDRLALVHARLDAPPLSGPELDGDPQDLAWRTAEVTGRFTDQLPYLVTGRFEAGTHGYDVVEPLQVDGGPVVLVNRGFIPHDGWEGALEQARVEGPTRVQGLVLPLQGRADVQPLPAAEGRPERWPMETETRLGMPSLVGPPYGSIAAHVGGPLAPVVLIAGPELVAGEPRPEDQVPAGGYIAEPKAIGHLEYAGQWFLIAATMVALWLWAGWQRGRRLSGAA